MIPALIFHGFSSTPRDANAGYLRRADDNGDDGDDDAGSSHGDEGSAAVGAGAAEWGRRTEGGDL